MHLIARSVLASALLMAWHSTALARKAPATEKPRSQADVEPAVRLQVFLDRAEFAPGKIDGRYGGFTLKALALYREAHGLPPGHPPPPAKGKAAGEVPPDVSGLDLAGVRPVFLSYTVTEADTHFVGDLPEAVERQAKLSSLPYKNLAEAVAEKFHCDSKFLEELNPGKTQALKAGDQLTVPDVEPFDLAAVKDLKPGDELPEGAANDREQEKEAKGKSSEEKATTSVKIDIKTNLLRLYEDDKLAASFPVTVGSGHTESPAGEWKVRGFEKMPKFRYDKSMLNHGERSGHFHMLPSGPNNPVGVLWIALNKKGIGLHGTSDPDSIGRSASHGCVRLANWDVVRLARRVKYGVPVSIH